MYKYIFRDTAQSMEFILLLNELLDESKQIIDVSDAIVGLVEALSSELSMRCERQQQQQRDLLFECEKNTDNRVINILNS